MGLKTRLEGDLAQAVKGRDAERVSTLRLLSAALRNEELARESLSLTDEEILRVIEREAKKRREAAQAFEGGGRPDAAARERAEEEILRAYLPAPMSDGEIEVVVREVLQSRGGQRNLGAVIRDVMGKLHGRADGARVRAVVSRILNT